MKSEQDIKNMIAEELYKRPVDIFKGKKLDYYNEVLGSTSFLLSGLLNSQLEHLDDWDGDLWLDDSLITKVDVALPNWSLWGVMILGKNGTTEQWTEPFYCFIETTENGDAIRDIHFLFGEEGFLNVSYENFKNDRRIFDENFYSNEKWEPSEPTWKYIISSKSLK